MNRDFEKRSREVFEVLSVLVKLDEKIIFLGGSAIQAILPEQKRLSIDLDISYLGETERLVHGLEKAGYGVTKRQSRTPIFVFFTISKGDVMIKLDVSRFIIPETEKRNIRDVEVLLPKQGYLLASKLSSLAFGTIGRFEEEPIQIIKDIFDINCILDNKPDLEKIHEDWIQIMSDQNRLRNTNYKEVQCVVGVQTTLLKCIEIDSTKFFIKQNSFGSFQEMLVTGRVYRNDLITIAARALLLLVNMNNNFYETEKLVLSDSMDIKKLWQAELELSQKGIFNAASLHALKTIVPKAFMYLYYWMEKKR